MKCPKCGYHSFDHLESCKKCGQDLVGHKLKFNLSGFSSPAQAATAAAVTSAATAAVDHSVAAESEPLEDEGADFGFDFLDEDEAPASPPAADISLDDDSQEVNIDQPFGVDSETIPADSAFSDSELDADGNSGKDDDFTF